MYALGFIVLVSLTLSFAKEDGKPWNNSLQSIHTETHLTEEVYEGALAIVVTDHEVLVSKQGTPKPTITSNSFILEFVNIEKVKSSLGNRIDIPTASLVRDREGSLYILNTSSGILITFKMESTPDRTSYFKNADVSVNKIFNPAISIATSQRMSADYAESVQSIFGERDSSLATVVNYDDGPSGPYEIACRCKSVSTTDDICNSGGTGATGCGITRDNGFSCSISGCSEDQYACCGYSDENEGN